MGRFFNRGSTHLPLIMALHVADTDANPVANPVVLPAVRTVHSQPTVYTSLDTQYLPKLLVRIYVLTYYRHYKTTKVVCQCRFVNAS